MINRQLQLIMTRQDEHDLLARLPQEAMLDRDSERKWYFTLPGYQPHRVPRGALQGMVTAQDRIRLLRSDDVDGVVTRGVLSLVTKDEQPATRKLESAFRALERYIKKNFSNRVLCRSEFRLSPTGKIPSTAPPTLRKIYWVGPGAQEASRNGEKVLRESLGSWTVFTMADSTEAV